MMSAWLVDGEGIPHALPSCGRAGRASPHQQQIVSDKQGQGDNEAVPDQPPGRYDSRRTMTIDE
jgi:hypothetical protein